MALFVLMLLTVSSPIKAETVPLAAPDMKKNAKPAVELGWKHFEKGDHETAMKRFQMAIRHDKNFAPGYYGVAYVYSVQGKLDEAIKYYRETIKRDQSYPYSYANLGYILLQKNQFDEALKMLDKT
jgi:Tfp pilus assembly protein PilF